jgi:V/A-type H+-transporting ATPase subunit D
MARAALNKSTLQKEHGKLRLYERLLPSLDLKRRQLTLELGRARNQLKKEEAEVEGLVDRIAEQMPMLADCEITLSGLVQLKSMQMEEENVVGVRLPVMKELNFTVQDYSMLANPHWVDALVHHLKTMAERRIRLKLAAERVRRLDKAVRRITQRVNLFEKILIPTTKRAIQEIQIFLGDAERAAVVRSKTIKAIHERRVGASEYGGERS